MTDQKNITFRGIKMTNPVTALIMQAQKETEFLD